MTRYILAISGLAMFLITGCLDNNAGGNPVGDDVALTKMGADDGAGGRACFKHGKKGSFWMGLLDLTDDQKKEIRSLMKGQRKKFRGMKKDMKNKSFAERRELKMQAMEEVLKIISPVLTEEQLAKVESMKAQFDAGKIPEEIVDAKVSRLTELLSLTAEQQVQVKEIISRRMQEGMELKQNAQSFDEMKETMKTHREETHAAIAGVLTEEQLKKFEDFKDKRKGRRKDCRRGDRGEKGKGRW